MSVVVAVVAAALALKPAKEHWKSCCCCSCCCSYSCCCCCCCCSHSMLGMRFAYGCGLWRLLESCCKDGKKKVGKRAKLDVQHHSACY